MEDADDIVPQPSTADEVVPGLLKEEMMQAARSSTSSPQLDSDDDEAAELLASAEPMEAEDDVEIDGGGKTAVAAAEAAAAAAPVDGAAEEAADSGLEQSLDTVPEPEEMWTKETVSLHVRFGEFITFLRGENEDLEWEMDNAPETIEAWKDWLKESVPAVTDVASTGVAAVALAVEKSPVVGDESAVSMEAGTSLHKLGSVLTAQLEAHEDTLSWTDTGSHKFEAGSWRGLPDVYFKFAKELTRRDACTGQLSGIKRNMIATINAKEHRVMALMYLYASTPEVHSPLPPALSSLPCTLLSPAPLPSPLSPFTVQLSCALHIFACVHRLHLLWLSWLVHVHRLVGWLSSSRTTRKPHPQIPSASWQSPWSM